MTVPLYDYIWRAQRRFAEVLSAAEGLEAELTAMVAADDTLADLHLPVPDAEAYYPVDNEAEASDLRENHLIYACLYPTGDDVITPMTGDLVSRTDEHRWQLTLALALTQEAGNETLTESWADMTPETRERRRLSVILAAATNVILRRGRNGVDVIQALPVGRPQHGEMPTDDGLVRWGKRVFEIISYTETAQDGSTA